MTKVAGASGSLEDTVLPCPNAEILRERLFRYTEDRQARFILENTR
jgi:hypothetical protein